MKNSDMPASPIHINNGKDFYGKDLSFTRYGLTKREAFAMAAMQNILNQYNPFEQGSFDSSEYDTVVENSWGLADAMLKYGDKK